MVGAGCRLPGGVDSLATYWELLRSGGDAVREVPADRWPIDAWYDADPSHPGTMNTRRGGFLNEIDGFDPLFFGISPREAAYIDPQHRLLLEVAWEAIEDAGLTPRHLQARTTGVFMAVYGRDYARLAALDPRSIDPYTTSGTHHSIAANRLSYWLDLRGPSLVVDTACSSSLVAVHLACQSLRRGECDIALCGGVNLMLAPEESVALTQWGMLAGDGRCKTFDARADGFVRGEGCGVLVLVRQRDAETAGHRMLAQIRGTAVNQDGRSNGLTAPNPAAQRTVIRQALHDACVASAQIGYVEAHGTGTALGDPIEVEALAAELRSGEAPSPCALGSVKASIGHLEAAAGIAGLLKTVLCLQHGEIPPQCHLEELNPALVESARRFRRRSRARRTTSSRGRGAPRSTST
ncbi:MAG: polyketide synthase [Acidobacteriota bacterium]